MNPSHLIYQIGTLRDKADRFLIRQLEKCGVEGLVPSHGSILNVLFSSGGQVQMKDLVERIHRSKSTVSELVNKLEAAGYVKRCECRADGRVCYVSLTDKGKEFYPCLLKISDELNQTMYEGFSQEEKEVFINFLKRVIQNLDD